MSENAVRLNPAEVNLIDNMYRQYAGTVYKYLRVYIRRISDSEIYDCVHNTFLTIIGKVKEIVYVRNIGGWIYRIAIMTAKNFNRKRIGEVKRRVTKDIGSFVLTDYNSAEDVVIRNIVPTKEEFYDKMHELYTTLNSDEVEVYRCIMHGMSRNEIMACLDMEANRVYYIYRSLEKRIRAYISIMFAEAAP